MRPLIIGEEQRAEIQRVRRHAEAHPFSRADLQRLIKTSVRIGNDPNFTCTLPVGFRVTFTIEEQPAGLCRHISVSVDTDGRWPSEAAVEMIMQEFGYRGGLKSALTVYPEEPQQAINVIELADRLELEQGARN